MTRDDDMDDSCVFAIEFTPEMLTAAFVSPAGEEEASASFDLCDFHAGESSPFDKFAALIAAKARTAPAPISRVAVSIACDLDAKRQKILFFPEASWLDGQPLPEMLRSLLNLPVVMEQRAVVRLCYDRAMLGLPDDVLAVGCYVDTNYENAVWHCGRPIVGRNGLAGNIAHMTVHDREDLCFCGKTGCVNLYGAGIRLRQIHSMIFPDTPIAELFVRHGDHPLLRDYLSMMAYPIAIEVNILDPDFVILGGRIPVMRDFPRKFLEDEIRRLAYSPIPDRQTVFLPTATGDVSGVVCAAQYALGCPEV